MSAFLSRYTKVEDRVLWTRYYALRRAVGDAHESLQPTAWLTALTGGYCPQFNFMA